MSKKIGFVCAVVGAMGMLGLNAAQAAPHHEKRHVTEKRPVHAMKKAKREGVAHIVRTSEVKTEHRAKVRHAVRKAKPAKRAQKARLEPVALRKVPVPRRAEGRVEHWGKIPVNIKVRDDIITKNSTEGGLLSKLLPVSNQVPAAAEDKPFSGIINHYAETYGVPLPLAHAVVHHESNYDPDVRGSAGEIGLMQVKLSTARSLGYTGSARELYNPVVNVQYGMKYLAMARELSGGSICGTILKYNAGHGATRMNPISARYCNQVKVYMRSF
ncbi:lytic transglycosylase domain-containing protein [Brucella sp. IR073]|uniref:lytic transglycosylase domain-containing protein n=1 Tax=unclassified Brucella TaxID=2632610 RepID=UPI003B98342E